MTRSTRSKPEKATNRLPENDRRAKAGKGIDEAARSPGPRDDADLRNDPETQDTPRSE